MMKHRHLGVVAKSPHSRSGQCQCWYRIHHHYSPKILGLVMDSQQINQSQPYECLFA